MRTARDWLIRHDPGYGATRRAVRAAIIMPALFALADKVIANPQMAYFVAFGSFAMLLLVDFQGSRWDRLRDQSLLGVTCVGLICLGTLASQWLAVAVVSMAVIAFAVLFAGVVSSVLAGATTASLLAFILPVSLSGTASAIPDRIAGWGLAAVLSLPAITLLWPAPARNPVRGAAIDACHALAARLRAHVAWVQSDGSSQARAAYDAVNADEAGAVEALQTRFFSTPFRPTGLTTDARAVVRLVDELRWLGTIVLRSAQVHTPSAPSPLVCAVKTAAADALDRAAESLDDPRHDAQELSTAIEAMRKALSDLEQATTSEFPASSAPDARGVITALDPSFRAQELAYAVGQVATNVEFAAAAARRAWIDRIVGRQPAGFDSPFASIAQRMAAHVRLRSSWLRNSLRGAVALALAVFVADELTVQHGFWVVFGTLSVLRSNALSTGQSVLRAVLGTIVGFAVGGLLVYLIGTETGVLWVLLPFVILFAGLAPAAISYTAGQAAFTLTLLILFNILVPAGWTIGLIRVEDIAIGCGVSLLVGLLFWPRGAAVALGGALSEAYVESVRYLSDAVAYGVGRCDAGGPQTAPPRAQALQASAAAHRLDDTFRGYLTERGVKPLPMSEVTSLVGGVAGVRLAADAILEMWNGDGGGGDRSAARRELLSAADQIAGWYDRFARSMARGEPVPDPLSPDRGADGRLVDTVAHDLQGTGGHATATGVRVIWTGDHLDAVRRLQQMLVEPARAAVAAHALS
jgi:hypothetical protein